MTLNLMEVLWDQWDNVSEEREAMDLELLKLGRLVPKDGWCSRVRVNEQ